MPFNRLICRLDTVEEFKLQDKQAEITQTKT